MYKIIGLKNIVHNLIKITNKHLCNSPTKEDLKNAYKEFLRDVQPLVPKPINNEFQFLSKRKDVEIFQEIFGEKSALDDFDEFFGKEENEDTHSLIYVQQTLDHIKNLYPDFWELIQTVIHTFFSAQSNLAGGGSTSAAIGCIWVNLRPHWNQFDVFEFIVHETTHNLIFLDELCYQHYTSYPMMLEKSNYAWSAILNKPRPLDKVFHSIIVCTEVLRFRADHLGHPEKPYLHPPTHIMLSQAQYSIQYIIQSKEIRSLLTNRALQLLEICDMNLKKIS